MAETSSAHYRWYLEDGIAIVEVLTRELNNPALAREFARQLAALVDARPANSIILDFTNTRYMSSTAFAGLFELARAAKTARIRLAICAMRNELKLGADILNLGQLYEFHPDLAAAREAVMGTPAP